MTGPRKHKPDHDGRSNRLRDPQMVWSNPPDRIYSKYEKMRLRLMQQPLKWALIRQTLSRHSASSTATRLRQKENWEEIEVKVTVADDGHGWMIHARSTPGTCQRATPNQARRRS